MPSPLPQPILVVVHEVSIVKIVKATATDSFRIVKYDMALYVFNFVINTVSVIRVHKKGQEG